MSKYYEAIYQMARCQTSKAAKCWHAPLDKNIDVMNHNKEICEYREANNLHLRQIQEVLAIYIS